MDILAQYEKENPGQSQVPQNKYDDQLKDHGPIIKFVMKISRGRIQNARQASFVLLATAVIISGASIYVFIIQNRNASPYHKPVPIKGHELNEVDWPPR